MLQCWNLRPDERPTASELVATFNPEAEELSGSDYTGSTVPVDVGLTDVSSTSDKHWVCMHVHYTPSRKIDSPHML